MTTKERLHELVDSLDEDRAERLLVYSKNVVPAPERDPEEDLPVELMTWLAAVGGGFDWVRDEPDLYTLEDGVPIEP